MPFLKKSLPRRTSHSSWRDYQATLPKGCAKPSRPRRRFSPRALVAGLFALITVFVLFGFIGGAEEQRTPIAASAQDITPAPESVSAPASTPTPMAVVDGPLDRARVRQLLDARMFGQLTEKAFALPVADGTLRVETTLDPDLQNYLLQNIDRKHSRFVGIVVMEALTGRVLALAGFDRTDAFDNPCLRSQFPAASIFKIVTAATAIDLFGYSVDSPMQFNGGKHTLYKGQLTDRVDRHTTTVPLREAFADSINPVFGKLGELRLGKPLLERAAANFGFNQSLDFDVPLPPSQFQIGDNPYNWAEIASGFNRQTTLSPLHGAALTAAVLNGGRMLPQTIVERIADDQGEVLYRPSPATARQIMSPRAAEALEQMMETTITSGTARKAFRGHQTDNVLAPLRIGGKTGSIGNPSKDVRYEWFVGYAKESQGQKQVVVSVMVGHEKFLGIRAGDYARRAITYYFSAAAAKERPAPAESAPAAGI